MTSRQSQSQGAPIPDGWPDDSCDATRPREANQPLPTAALNDDWPEYVVPRPPVKTAAPNVPSPVEPTPHSAPDEGQVGAAIPAATPFPKVGLPLKFPGFATRSALFQVGGAPGGPLSGPLASSGQYELNYFGPRLSMRDKRIWEMAMTAAQAHGWLDSEFRLSLWKIAKGLGLKDRSSKTADSIFESLQRLALADLSFTINGYASGRGKLLGSARKGGSLALVSASGSFAGVAFTKDTRFERAAPESRIVTSLGKWLLDFVWVNEEYKPGFDVEYLLRLSGSGASSEGFVKHLRKALKEVSAAAPDVLVSSRIDEVGRDAGKWMVFMERGAEVPPYERPQKERSKGPGSSKGRKGQKKPKKGGVAL